MVMGMYRGYFKYGEKIHYFCKNHFEMYSHPKPPDHDKFRKEMIELLKKINIELLEMIKNNNRRIENESR